MIRRSRVDKYTPSSWHETTCRKCRRQYMTRTTWQTCPQCYRRQKAKS